MLTGIPLSCKFQMCRLIVVNMCKGCLSRATMPLLAKACESPNRCRVETPSTGVVDTGLRA